MLKIAYIALVISSVLMFSLVYAETNSSLPKPARTTYDSFTILVNSNDYKTFEEKYLKDYGCSYGTRNLCNQNIKILYQNQLLLDRNNKD